MIYVSQTIFFNRNIIKVDAISIQDHWTVKFYLQMKEDLLDIYKSIYVRMQQYKTMF